MAEKISWTRDWDTQDYTGFSPKQIKNATRIYRKLAKILIDNQIKKLGNRPKITRYTTAWGHDETTYFFNTYITPAAVLKPKPRKPGKPKHGIGPATVNPAPPPKP